jgi:hypothetical protein
MGNRFKLFDFYNKVLKNEIFNKDNFLLKIKELHKEN